MSKVSKSNKTVLSAEDKQRKKRRTAIVIKRQIPFYILMLPGLICLAIFCYLPLPGILVAFKDYNWREGILGSPWVDPIFKNFEFFFESDVAFRTTFNTLFYNIIQMILGPALAITVAILLNEIRGKVSASVYKGAILLPTFLSWVIVQYIMYALLNPGRGIFSSVFGIQANFYMEPSYWRVIMPLVYLWKGFGYSSVLYVAAISGINTDYYEAADLDGASRWQKIKYITLPMLKPTFMILMLMSVGNIFRGGAGDWQGFVTATNNSGMLYPTTDVIDSYVYRALRTLNDYGMSAAASLYQSIIGFALVLISDRIIHRIDPDSSML